jgi:uncharacterized coiled-coil protein SlyX
MFKCNPKSDVFKQWGVWAWPRGSFWLCGPVWGIHLCVSGCNDALSSLRFNFSDDTSRNGQRPTLLAKRTHGLHLFSRRILNLGQPEVFTSEHLQLFLVTNAVVQSSWTNQFLSSRKLAALLSAVSHSKQPVLAFIQALRSAKAISMDDGKFNSIRDRSCDVSDQQLDTIRLNAVLPSDLPHVQRIYEGLEALPAGQPARQPARQPAVDCRLHSEPGYEPASDSTMLADTDPTQPPSAEFEATASSDPINSTPEDQEFEPSPPFDATSLPTSTTAAEAVASSVPTLEDLADAAALFSRLKTLESASEQKDRMIDQQDRTIRELRQRASEQDRTIQKLNQKIDLLQSSAGSGKNETLVNGKKETLLNGKKETLVSGKKTLGLETRLGSTRKAALQADEPNKRTKLERSNMPPVVASRLNLKAGQSAADLYALFCAGKVIDVLGDGNCGYRALDVAEGLKQDPIALRMRILRYLESSLITTELPQVDEWALKRLKSRLFPDGRMPTQAALRAIRWIEEVDLWLSDEMLFVIAQILQRPVCWISRDSNKFGTYLPRTLRDVNAPLKSAIALVHTGNELRGHFQYVDMSEQVLLPPVVTWEWGSFENYHVIIKEPSHEALHKRFVFARWDRSTSDE